MNIRLLLFSMIFVFFGVQIKVFANEWGMNDLTILM